MKNNILTLATLALTAAMAACNSENTANRIEFPGTIDNEAFAANVESISVENLQMEDNWALAEMVSICLSDNYLYMIESTKLQLTCFNRQTGEKLSNRSINGNGPGEINELNSMFCIGDTLCIYDSKGSILKYDNGCHFIGKMHEFSDLSWRYNIVRLDNGNYVFVSITNPDADDNNPAMMLADKDFNIISKHFDVPQAQISFFDCIDPCFVVGDTIRSTFLFDCKLYTLSGETEQVTELAVPNPVTPEIANESFASGDFMALDTYDGTFSTICGSGRFLLLSYHIGDDHYMTTVDYRTNKATSILISDVEDNLESTASIVGNLILKSGPVKNADGYIYLRTPNSNMAKLLEGHDDLLDARLKATKASYRAYLERNAEYIKSLEPEELDAVNVLLKIKLKD